MTTQTSIYPNLKLLLTIIALAATLFSSASYAEMLNVTKGGTFTFDLDRDALAPYVFGNAFNNNGYYLANFWDSAESDYTNPAYSITYFRNNMGSTEIPALNLVHDLMPIGPNPTSQPTGRHVMGTTAGFTIDSNTLAGVAGEKLGMTGVHGFYLTNFTSSPRIFNGDFSLEFDASRQTDGRSGWYLANNLSFTMIVYDLANLNLTQSSGVITNWLLTGNILMSPENAGMLQGASYTDVGNFSLGLGTYANTVPAPASIWLFFSGLLAWLANSRRNKAVKS
jgi:hypothetical protein